VIGTLLLATPRACNEVANPLRVMGARRGRLRRKFEVGRCVYLVIMNEEFFTELSAWLTEAGLAGTPETTVMSGFCDRCVAAGLPLARSLMFIDTLHPIHEGRLFRWGYDQSEAPLLE
jgi:hypothetical protein